MSDGMGREPAYLSSHATNRYFIPNWGSSFGGMKTIGYKVSKKRSFSEILMTVGIGWF